MLSALGLSYLWSSSNYNITNVVNVYNTLINIIDITPELDNKKKIIKIIKLQLGITFYSSFRDYINHKYSSDDELFILVNHQ